MIISYPKGRTSRIGDSEQNKPDKSDKRQNQLDRTVEEIDNMGKPREEPTRSPSPNGLSRRIKSESEP